jgi:MFS transporter, PAT family, beta-lactamase induction signal transducer AmpG
VAIRAPSGAHGSRAGKLPLRSALWVSTTYFAEGYPYSIVNNLAEVLFRELGASLRLIGLTALFHLPWNLKFLWGPVLDRYETKRRWLLGTEIVLTVLLAALVLGVAGHGPLGWLAALFVLLGVVAATHDIAIDGFYLEGLDERGQSRFVGYRAMAYKVASLLVRGPLLIVVGWVGWSYGLAAAAALMLALTALHFVIVPRVETPARRLRELVTRDASPAVPVDGDPRPKGSFYTRAFVDFLRQPKVGRILAFVVLFRAGESFLQKMRWPFLRDVLGMSLETYGFTNGTIGVAASFVGTLVGGALIARQGLRRWIWPCALAQNVLTLLYFGLALGAVWGRPGLASVTAVITIEHFGEGAGTAVLMVFLMRCCDPAHKAAHMALLTAVMSLAFTLAGGVSGFVAEAIGFPSYFALSFVATIPAMVLIPLLPYLDGRARPAPP